jgi:hypothetical protein
MANHHVHEIPERTTPQGTQEEGVEFGHEERDVNFRPVFRWFIALAAVTGLTQLMLALGLAAWMKHEEKLDVPPSRVFAVQQQAPEPRLLPNPVDSPPTSREPQIGPMEALRFFRQREDQALQRHGLQDAQTGLPTLPPRAVAAVTAQPTAPAPGGRPRDALTQPMPSSSSGGTAMENRLR